MSASEPPRALEIVEEPQSASNPFLEQAEAVLAAAEACDLSDDSDHDAYHEAALWFYENARELLDVVRERDRLDWLRKNPESCRAAKDCRKERAVGYIHCPECLTDDNAGGYFDVYQRYYDEKHTAIFDGLMERLDKALHPDD